MTVLLFVLILTRSVNASAEPTHLASSPASNKCAVPLPCAGEVRVLSYGLVVDNSVSLASQRTRVRTLAESIVKHSEEQSEVFLVTFIDSVNLEQELTKDHNTVLEPLQNLFSRGGKTALWDALYLAGKYLVEHRNAESYRRALILITDGDERASHHKEAQVVELLRNQKLPVIIVGLVSELEKQYGKKAQKRATHLLKSLAKNAGSRVFFVDATSDPAKITRQILGSMPQ